MLLIPTTWTAVPAGSCEQCPVKSWLEHGTLDTPIEYFCEIAHTQARYLRLLEDGEMPWEVRNWRERIRDFSVKEPISREGGRAETGAGDG